MEGYHERNLPNLVLSISGEAVIWILTASLDHAPSRIQQSTQSLSSSQLTVSHWLPSLLSQRDFSYRWNQLCLVLLLVNTDAHFPSTCSVSQMKSFLRQQSRSPCTKRAGWEVTGVFLMHQEVWSVVCRVGGWQLQDLSLVVLLGSLDSIVLLVSWQGFCLFVVVVCVLFCIYQFFYRILKTCIYM